MVDFSTKRGTKIYYPPVNKVNPGKWNKKCFIIGGGASSKTMNLRLLKDHFVIGINYAYVLTHSLDVIFMIDIAAYKRAQRHKRFLESPALKIWCLYYNYEMDGIYYMKHCGRFGISRILTNGLFHGNNSGYCGIQLAIALGFRDINLIGFDCNKTGDQWHAWEKWGNRPDQEKVMVDFKEGFEQLSIDIKETDIKIYNLNKNSAICGFPFRDYGEALNVQ